MQSEPIHKNWHLDAAALRQVGDVAVVADVAVETENIPGLLGFDDVRAILGAAEAELGRLDGQRIRFGKLLRQHRAVFIIGARFSTKGGSSQ